MVLEAIPESMLHLLVLLDLHIRFRLALQLHLFLSILHGQRLVQVLDPLCRHLPHQWLYMHYALSILLL